MLAASTRLGPYEILGPLGAGGMGEVYRARDTRLGREVAVKVLPEPFANDPNRRARFEREAQVVAALSHPNLLALHDYGTHGNVTFAVTELLEGETLRSRLAKGPLPWRKAVEIGVAIAEGLAAAHAKGIIHRDLKPDNLFLTADGRVKVLDFGLAQVKPVPDSEMPTGPYVVADTDPGTVMGTVGYMSPEQVRGRPADARSDIFSLGCVLYEMVSGRRAFAGETTAETMTAILRDDPAGLGDSQNVSPEVERLIRHCLEKNPEERFQSARDLAFAFRAVLSGLDVTGDSQPVKPRRKPARRPRRRAIHSLAVLPLVNATSDSQADYLSDGITESVIHTLSHLPTLRVIARSTAFRYKGRDVDPQVVGGELGVQALVTGRVASLGGKLTVGVELVDVADGALLWGRQYKRQLADILAVEEEISTDIAENLRLKLTGEDKERLTKQYTKNSEAYQLYLKGRFYWNKRTEAAFVKGIEYFEQAIQTDRTYALAHTGLADSYILLGSAAFEFQPPKETMPRAKRAAEKALRIDDSLAEAHTTRAQINRLYDWKWLEAERGFQRALELNPNYATAHHWYALLLTNLGRMQEALAEIRRAQQFDPLSLAITTDIGWCSYFARRFDDAIEEYRKALEMDPGFFWAHYLLGLAYAQESQFPAAVEQFQRAIRLSEGSTKVLGPLGHAIAMSGQKAEAQRILSQMEALSQQKYVSSYAVALVHLGLAEEDRAVERLQQAYQERAGHMVYLKVDPYLDPLRDHSSFSDLLRRMKFPR